MTRRKFLLASCLLALASGAPSTGLAEAARGQVLSRQLASGERLIFSWDSPNKVPFTIDNRGERIMLHFERPVALKWKPALRALSPYIRNVETSEDGDTVTLTLSSPSKAEYYDNPINDNTRGTSINQNGIDLVESEADFEEPEEETESPPSKPRKAWRRPAAHKHARKQVAQRTRPKAIAATAGELAALSPTAGTPEPDPEPTSPSAGAEPVPERTMAASGSENATEPAEPVVKATSAQQGQAEPETAVPAFGKVVLPLPFKAGESFAAFAWKGNLWVVSDKAYPLLADELGKSGAPLLKAVHAVEYPHATILYAPIEDGISASVEKTLPDHVQLALRRGPGSLAQPLSPALRSEDGKSSLLVPAARATAVITFRDPQTGDTLNVIPLPEAGSGLAAPRSFVEFNLLQSAQGVVIQKKSDAVSVAVQNGVVQVSSPDGLAISPQMAQELDDAASVAESSRLPQTLFPYARWKLEDEKDFVPAQLKLFRDIAFNPSNANKSRLKLLGLYLSEGLFAEATGVADEILRSSLKFYQDNKVAALRGAAYFFMYRLNEAQRDFSAPELASDPEASFWRSLTGALLGENKDTFHFSDHYERYISHYPPVFIQKLGLIAADQAITGKQYDAASLVFDTLKKDGQDEPVKKYITYLQGKILSETHSESEAATLWEEQAKQVDDPLVRARAEFSLVNMQIKNGKISNDEAIKRLDRLRIVWRGDSLERSVLTLLSTLYVHEKQYDKALRAMRDIVLFYPQEPETVGIARQMEDTFVTLYNKGGADSMPPLEALSLFYEFRDLVPTGNDGDLMIRNLADRLVSIDLLDRASLLLDHQIRNRLEGEQRSRVGAQLAHVYLLNHQSEKALDILKTTGYGELPQDLQLARLRLTAQALAQEGKTARAIDVISTDNSPESTQLRLSIYWDNKDWPNVVTIAEDILGNRNDPSAPLTQQESDVLLKLATAYVYEHDSGQLQYLRDYFTPLMKNNPNQASFQFITTESGNVNYDNLGTIDQDINAVKSFLASTQEKPGKNGLSPRATN